MLREAVTRGVLVADGAMGTLGRLRPGLGDRPIALWALESPGAVEALHREYVDAGARLVVTNTFGASRAWLAQHGAAEKVRAVNQAAVDAARRAAGSRAFVLGSIGPVARSEPRPYARDVAVDEYREQAMALVDAAVDGIVIETMYEVSDLECALEAVRSVRGDLFVAACMTFDAAVRAPDGTTPARLLAAATAYQVDAIGANCCDGPESTLSAIESLSELTDLPLWAKPSAGLPEARDGRLRYPETPESMVRAATRLVSAGASVVGGCCGTTPETVAAISAALRP